MPPPPTDHTSPTTTPPGDHGTTEDQGEANGVDDQFRALLEGLRTTLPGAEMLVGFLLIVPLQPAFGSFDALERGSYYIAFLAAALAVVLLIAPSAHQRLRAPITGISRSDERHLRITVWVTIAGTMALATAVAASVFLVSRIVFSSTVATIAVLAVTATIAWAWFFLPLVTFDER